MVRENPKPRTILDTKKKSRTINPGPFSGLEEKIPDAAPKASRASNFFQLSATWLSVMPTA